MSAAVGSFEPVAIVGYGCVVPDALTPDALWSIAATGASAITTVTEARWGVPPERLLIDATAAVRKEGSATDRGGLVRGFAERFDPEGFAVDAASVRAADDLTRWLLHAGREALRAAGRDRRPTAFRRGGAIVGNLGYPTDELAAYTSAVWDGEPAANPIHRFTTGRPIATLAAALGLDAGGFALDAACASSLYAIKLACDRLHDGAADFMLAGAVNRIQSITLFGGFTALGALSPTGRSRPFHRDADGLLPAEGAVLFVLKRLSAAIADGDDVRAVIRGVGLSNDGRGKGLLVPRAEGQLAAMRAAYAAAGLAPADVSFVECHATGTQLGDATELESMGALFAGLRDVPIGSFKANLGHLVTASGGAGLVKVVEGMRHGIRPGTPGIDDVVDRLAESPFRLLHTAEPWAVAGPRIAGVSSFGFGGNNAHLVVEEWTAARQRAFAVAGRPVPQMPAPRPRVAIVALAAQIADGADADDFRLHLLGGKRRGTNDGARAAAIPFGPREIRIAPNDMRKTLPQHLLALRVAIDAAAATTVLPVERTGAYVGTQCDPNVTRFGRRLRRDDLGSDLCARETGLGAVDATSVLGAMPNMPANRIGAHLDLKGPSFVVFREERSGFEALLLAAGEITPRSSPRPTSVANPRTPPPSARSSRRRSIVRATGPRRSSSSARPTRSATATRSSRRSIARPTARSPWSTARPSRNAPGRRSGTFTPPRA
jgi:acyl transferase domain-containing protein